MHAGGRHRGGWNGAAGVAGGGQAACIQLTGGGQGPNQPPTHAGSQAFMENKNHTPSSTRQPGTHLEGVQAHVPDQRPDPGHNHVVGAAQHCRQGEAGSSRRASGEAGRVDGGLGGGRAGQLVEACPLGRHAGAGGRQGCGQLLLPQPLKEN